MKKLLATVLFAVLMLPAGARAEILKNLRVGGQLDLQSNSARNIQDFTTRDRTPSGGPSPNYNDRIGNTLTRTMVDVHWDLLDDVHAELTFRKNNRMWGSSTTVSGVYPSSSTQVATQNPDTCESLGGNGNGILDQLCLNRANITIDKFLGFADVTLGRQYYGTPGDLILYWGPKDSYGLPATAIDAVAAKFETDYILVTGLAGTTKSSRYPSVGSVNSNAMQLSTPSYATHVRGMDIALKIPHVKIHTYAWNQLIQAQAGLGNTLNAAGENDSLYVYGLKVRGEARGEIFGAWMNLDAAFNTGTCTTSGNCYVPRATPADYLGTHYNGYGGMVDTGFNLDIPNVGGFTPWGHFAWGSGRGQARGINDGFYTIASDYRPGIINRRFGNLLFDNYGLLAASDGSWAAAAGGPTGGVGTTGLNNRVVWGAGMNMTIAAIERLTTSFQFWDYRFQRNTIGDTDFTTTVPTEKTSRSVGNRHIGSEAGMTMTWNHSENVSLTLGGATFQPGGFIRNWVDNRNRTTGITNTGGRGLNPAYAAFADWMVRF